MPTTVRSSLPLLLTLTALTAISVSTAVSAQTPDPIPGSYMQAQPAPIERTPGSNSTPNAYPSTYPNGHSTASPDATADTPRRYQAPPAVKTSQPAQGVYVRMSPQGAVTTVSASAERTELRVESGIVNISVHHPAQNALILVDLGSGQLDLIKDGMYTFNASTKTARVLVGEARAFPNTDGSSNAKPVKVKEDHAVTFSTNDLHAVEFQLFDARADVLPRPNAERGDAVRSDYPAYGYGFYGGGYPYYAYDYPYAGWGNPYYGWGYPYGLSLGFGFYGGGFYGGGFRGGFRGRR